MKAPTTILALLAAAAITPSPPAAAAPPAFKIYVEEDGVYRVSFADLAAARPGLEPVASAGLGVANAGEPVPIQVEDGGDGVFGPGDRIELLGRHAGGEVSYFSPYSRFNVYRLRLDDPAPARMTAGGGEPPVPDTTVAAYLGRLHLEQDLLVLRLPPPADGRAEEVWFWARLVHNQEEPWILDLDLADLDRGSDRPVRVKIGLRGWSLPHTKPEGMTDHRVEATLDGIEIASSEWDGTRPHLLAAELPAAAVGAGVLALKIPPRGEPRQELIDVVMLNWIEIEYPRAGKVFAGQDRFEIAAATPGPETPAERLQLLADADAELVVYGTRGARIDRRQMRSGDRGADRRLSFVRPPGEDAFLVATPDALAAPAAVVYDRPSRLTDPANRADYLMIAHRTLMPAIEPLADFHRGRGLAVEVIDVEDVYDEFHDGLVHPRALRDFLAHAYQHWTAPAPRFVLLVGDASWDGRNALARDQNYADWTYRRGEAASFLKNDTTPYAENPELNQRGLVPTWSHLTPQGHTASDNYFVTVAGGDHRPDMAIGRLPVVTPEEVTAIVAKTVRYAANPEDGPWRHRTLLITNESEESQGQSDLLATTASRLGLTPVKIYPAASEASNEHPTRRLLEAFDEGQLLVHFLGHGGRYIWRTGPRDLTKKHDLFSLDDLDQLRPNGRLPIVLSMTCYSAPFDHPNADSIGEKLLRIPQRGAVAVLAASWRNDPSWAWGRTLFQELTVPGTTVGEAVMRAKQRIGSRDFIATYNLLGDPALPVALPEDLPARPTAPGETAKPGAPAGSAEKP